MIAAVIFDLDGVLIDSEGAWDEARRALVDEQDGTWTETATRDMQGMSSLEWSRYLHNELGVPLEPPEISDRVVQRLMAGYRRELPLIDGATQAVERLAAEFPLGLASSSNRELVRLVLDEGGLAPHFAAWVSSEEVERGKPAPDVYVEAARRLDVAPERCAAVEDSHNGILSARAAGMRVLALPNREFPPGDDALEQADLVLARLEDLVPETVAPG